jgi:hypothetical protein
MMKFISIVGAILFGALLVFSLQQPLDTGKEETNLNKNPLKTSLNRDRL